MTAKIAELNTPLAVAFRALQQARTVLLDAEAKMLEMEATITARNVALQEKDAEIAALKARLRLRGCGVD